MTQPHNVLIVDDLALNRIMLSDMVEEAGCQFKFARNGKEAIEKLEQEHFDIIFMDIEMPVMNGFEATRFIRNKMLAPKNTIPIVAVSAHDPESFWEDFINVGFDKLLGKPFALKKIKRTIDELIKKD